MKSVLTLFSFFQFFHLNLSLAQDITNAEFIKIDPSGTYLFTDKEDKEPNTEIPGTFFYPKPATFVDLTEGYADPNVLLKPGDYIYLKSNGDFRAGVSDLIESGTGITAVFWGPSGFLAPGPQSLVQPAYTLPTFSLKINTDILEDFVINKDGVRAQIPEGATHLLFSSFDSNFANNTDPNNDFGVFAAVQKNGITFIKNIANEANNNLVEILPSFTSCNKSIQSQKILTLYCKIGVNFTDKCRVQINTLLGKNHGGHKHAKNHRPLGNLFIKAGIAPFAPLDPSKNYKIPNSGIQIKYIAPEISGDVKLNFNVLDDIGIKIISMPTIFRVKAKGSFQPIPSQMNYFNIYAQSHSKKGQFEDGNFALPITIATLNNALAKYYQLISKEKVLSITIPDSQGASLSWGGLFDAEQAQGKEWMPPHCGHRDGKTMDFSMSVFNIKKDAQKQKDVFAKALIQAGFRFYYVPHSPNTKTANHWHAQLKR